MFKITELYLNQILRYNIKSVRQINFNFGVKFREKRGKNTLCVLCIMG